jgi:hypothetical protein
LHEREAADDERERVLAEREQQLAVATPTPRVPGPGVASKPPVMPAPPVAAAQGPAFSPDATFQTFYDDLAPYGSWIQMPGYGYVWQPLATVQDPAWRPYTLGHWAFTDNGWTWISDERFGWITYHYGRWMRTRSLNWTWVPGDQWAPAWVSWRYGGDYVGWAPLPPDARFDGATGIQQWADQQYNLGASDYTFVPASEFGDDSMASVAVPPDEDAGIYDASNNLTNIYYDPGAYAIICYGPNYDFMRSKSHRPLPPKLKIQRADLRGDGRNGTLITGNTLQITAPSIIQSQTPTRPGTVIGAQLAESRLISHPAVAYQAPRAAPPAQIPAPANTAPEPGALGPRIPSQVNPVNPPPGTPDARTSLHDLQVIAERRAAEQQAAEQDRQREEAARTAEEHQAEQQRAARAAAEEQSAKAAREQEQIVREQAAHAAQPASVPATAQPGTPGHEGQ